MADLGGGAPVLSRSRVRRAGLADPVQYVANPPVHLGEWLDPERSSRIIFILDGLAPDRLKASLAVFNGLGA